uniref:Uncharacterized protein n=1 Tax=Peronospora matthiolae TaxID=2874970 RepID=A0AAV1UUT3_9STRA
MRLNFALPLLAASFFAALDALPPRGNPVLTSLGNAGDQGPRPELSRIDGEERVGGEYVEGAMKLVEGAQNWISSVLSKLLVEGAQNRISSVLSKLLNKKARTWSMLDPATVDNLVAHKDIMQSYNELAREDISELKMVSELTDRHTHQGVASWISALKGLNSEGAKSIAARLQAGQTQQLAENAFIRLRLSEGVLNTKKGTSSYSKYKWRFDDPKFAYWKAYVETINQRDPAMTIIETLTHYLDDEHLAHALILASMNPELEVMIAELQTALLRFWVRGNVNPDKVTAWLSIGGERFDSQRKELKDRYTAVFSWRGLDVATQDTLFQHEKVMRSYMMLDDENLEGEHMLAELISRHSDEEVAKALIAVTGVKDERYKNAAKELLELQYAGWDRDRHEHPSDYVFKLLGLNNLSSGPNHVRTAIGEAESLFYNPNFKVWEEYLNRITGGDSEEVIAEMKKTMLRVHGKGVLDWLLDAAIEGGGSMGEFAAKLRAAQVEQ